MNRKLKNYKTSLGCLLSQIPFPRPLTPGFFYREKMRAIFQFSRSKILPEIIKAAIAIKFYLSKDGIQYLPRDVKGRLFYSRNNTYGIPEPLINFTILRFWLYPSYWRYLFTKTLHKFGLWHPEEWLQNSRNRYLTGRPDPLAGVGHQLSNWNAALIYSKKYNLQFVHQPLSTTDDYDWEEFLDLGADELHYDAICRDKSIKKVRLPRVRWIENDPYGDHVLGEIITCAYPGSNVIFHLASDSTAPNVYDQTPTAEILSNKYRWTRERPPVDSTYQMDGLNVACHVRRGDIVTSNQNNVNLKKRWLNSSYFIKIVNTIKNILPNQKIYIHVFSQGSIEQFRDFEQIDDVTFHLDEDQFQTFHHMVIADILIVSPSSFSYKAGLFSKGIKIARYPWWHEIPENSEWIRSDETGCFNTVPIIQRYADK